jgi:prepilin-type N-terminal cleavage/methylation domain-containing protein
MTKRAFTLIELLVVIAIIGILACTIQPALTAANEHARLQVCRGRLMEIGLALRMYMSDWDAAPADLADLHALGYLDDETVFECAYAHAPFDYRRPGAEAARDAVVASCPNHPHGRGRSGAVLFLNGKVVVERQRH